MGRAASADEVVSARRVISRCRAEARAVLASTVASGAATISGPAGVAVVVLVSVGQISRAGTAVRWSAVVSRTGGATVVRPAVSRWPRGSSVVLRPSVSCGAREVWTCGASMVWSTVSEVSVRETGRDPDRRDQPGLRGLCASNQCGACRLDRIRERRASCEWYQCASLVRRIQPHRGAWDQCDLLLREGRPSLRGLRGWDRQCDQWCRIRELRQ
ncbi:hypothetical protein MTO96_049602 [Rhipicephalus appendiculatus]